MQHFIQQLHTEKLALTEIKNLSSRILLREKQSKPRMKDISQYIYLTKNIYPEYIKNFHKLLKKKKPRKFTFKKKRAKMTGVFLFAI